MLTILARLSSQLFIYIISDRAHMENLINIKLLSILFAIEFGLVPPLVYQAKYKGQHLLQCMSNNKICIYESC